MLPKGLFVDAPELTIRKGFHYIESCGQCGCWHPEGYTGDCRSDANRYSDYENYAERNGVHEDFVVEVEQDDAH